MTLIWDLVGIEVFDAYLWEQVETDDITEFTAEMIDRVTNKFVIIVGDYYTETRQIPALAIMFYLYSDVPIANSVTEGLGYTCFNSESGFVSLAVEQIDQPEPYLVKIAEYLDSYVYATRISIEPREEAASFHRGVYLRPGETNLAKLLSIESLDDVTATVELGRKQA